jgi:hypothetical protein
MKSLIDRSLGLPGFSYPGVPSSGLWHPIRHRGDPVEFHTGTHHRALRDAAPACVLSLTRQQDTWRSPLSTVLDSSRRLPPSEGSEMGAQGPMLLFATLRGRNQKYLWQYRFQDLDRQQV